MTNSLKTVKWNPKSRKKPLTNQSEYSIIIVYICDHSVPKTAVRVG